ncbi:PH domain-containing protein [Geodermatophilus sp. SYSU D00815]
MPTPARPVSAVPRVLRLVCAVLAAVVLVAMTWVALRLPESSTGVVAFGAVDQVAVLGLGVLVALGILLLGRPRVDADAEGVRVRNLFTAHALPWSAVRAVRFERKAPWASLLLPNGDEIAVMAVQAVDKERAVAAVEGLRALQAAAAQAAGAPGSTGE